MRVVGKIGRFFFGIWYLTLFVGLTIISGSICILLSFVSGAASRFITSSIWSHIVLDPALIKMEVTGREHLPSGKGFIIYANHRSLLDIPTVSMATGKSVSWVAKAALGRIPFFGWALARTHLLVDRTGGAEAARKMLLQASVRLAKGEIMVIFPEGTRNRTAEPVLPFKKGAFILAKHTGVPLVPLAIVNTGRLWPAGALLPHSGTIRVALGPAISVGPKDNLAAISDRAFAALSGLYLELERQAEGSGKKKSE